MNPEEEIKKLRAENAALKDEMESMRKQFDYELSSKDYQISQLEGSVQSLEDELREAWSDADRYKELYQEEQQSNHF